MNDEFLKPFRKEPRPEFAEALYKKLARQRSAGLPKIPFSQDGRVQKKSDIEEEEAMNGITHFPQTLPGRRWQGYLVALAAALLVIIVSSLLIVPPNNFIGVFDTARQDNPNLALANQWVELMKNRAQLIKTGKFGAVHRTLFKDPYTYHDLATREVQGVSGLADCEGCWDNAIIRAFPDLQFNAEKVVAQGDLVFVHYSTKGTFENPFVWGYIPTLQPTGKTVEEEGVYILRIEDGKIAEIWWYADNPWIWVAKSFILERWREGDQAQEIYNATDKSKATQDTEAANLALVKKWVKFNQNRAELVKDRVKYLEAFEAIHKPLVLWHDSTTTLDLGVPAANFFTFDKAILTAFPDLQFSVEQMVVQGDRVFVQYATKGTFVNPFKHATWGSVEPSGEMVEEEGTYILRIEDGKIAEQWWYVDSPWLWVDMALLLKKNSGIAGSQIQSIYKANDKSQVDGKALANRFMDAWEQRAATKEQLQEFISNDVEVHNLWGQDRRGMTWFMDTLYFSKTYMPDIHYAIETRWTYAIGDDTIAFRYVGTGTVAGQSARDVGTFVLHWNADGKIDEIWWYSDGLSSDQGLVNWPYIFPNEIIDKGSIAFGAEVKGKFEKGQRVRYTLKALPADTKIEIGTFSATDITLRVYDQHGLFLQGMEGSGAVSETTTLQLKAGTSVLIEVSTRLDNETSDYTLTVTAK